MKTRQWYRARIRWAEMVEGRGIRHWEEGLYLFRSEDREAAFRRALEIGEGGQSGGEEDGRQPRWVETRLAEVATLDCLGSELEDEPLEVHWMRLPAREKITFRPQVRAGWEGAAQVAVTGHGGRMFLEDPGLRFALNARPTASQGFAPAGAFQKHERVIFRKDRASEFISKRIKRDVCACRRE